MQRRSRPLLALVIALLLVHAPLAAAQQATPTAVPESDTLDLAAMALMPDDLPWSGFVVGAGQTRWTDQLAAEAANYLDDDAGTIDDTLTADGFLREYELALLLADPALPSQIRIEVDSTIRTFESAKGAKAAFSYLENESDEAETEDVADADAIGDQSEVTTSSGLTSDSELAFDTIDVSFREGDRYGIVSVTTYAAVGSDGTAVELPDDIPVVTVANAIALADDLLAKMTGVADGTLPAPGLSTQVLRFDRDDAVGLFDNYDRVGGVSSSNAGENADDLALREAGYGGATDVYDVEYAIDGNASTVQRIFRFRSEDDASAWLAESEERFAALAPDYTEITPIEDDLKIGDEAVGYAYTWTDGEGTTTHGYRIYVRVGSLGALVQIDADPGVNLDAVIAVAKQQARCLATADPCAPVSPPSKLIAAE